MNTSRDLIIKKSFQVVLLAASILFFNFQDTSAQCNCKFTIPAGQGYVYFDGAAKGVKAGDVICVSSGSIQTIQFVNIKGAAGNPVVIKNCGGQVLIGGASANNGMLFTGSKYVHVTGTGDAATTYGFKIQQTVSGSQGFAYTGLSTDIEIDHMEIAKAGYAGIMAKTDPSSNCADLSAVRPNFSLTNVSIHDNYIHDSQGEGIYLGDSFYLGTTVFCGSMEYCHDVKGVRIYNNRFENTGRESIQVGAATTDVEIYNNQIFNYGAQNLAEQNGGVQLGLGTAARFYNNFIKGGTGPALAIQGIGNDYVYNNIFINPGQQAITINTRATPLSTDIVNKGYLGGVYIINNTFVNAAQGAVIEFVNGAPGNVMYNNLIVASASVWDKTYTYTDWKKGNNIAIPLLANAKFANAAGDDYHLLAGSSAIDAGKDVSAWGVTFDYDRKGRPSGAAVDAGAFEFTATAGAAPVANAGADKTITLPTNTLTLTGTGTDSDGTIASYAWTKTSGPAATLANAATSSLALSGLVAGTYVFRLTVKDNSNLTGYDEITVVVKPALVPPTVNAGADQTISLPTVTGTLTGSATDTDGTISAYAWTKQSGPAATLSGIASNVLSLASLIAGTYVFRLTATDNSGLTAYDEVTVTVKPQTLLPQNPVVNAGADKSITLPTSTVSLTASASDADGTIASYAWTKTSGPAATLAGNTTTTLTASALTSGTYVFRVTVTDNTSLTAFDEVTVIVNPAPAASGTVRYRINAGGPTTITASPMNWMADYQAGKSIYLDAASSNYTCGAVVWTGTNTTGAPDDIFGPNRYSPNYNDGTPMQWNFPVVNGVYEVRLFFAETPYAGGVKTAGARVFSVKMEGTAVLSNFDIYATAGMNATKKVFTVTVSDGTLDIDFVRVTGNPQVNGIEILTSTGSTSRVEAPEEATALTEPVEEPTVDVYPNPFHYQINLTFPTEQKQVAVSLLNMSGHPVFQEIIADATEHVVDLSNVNLPSGMYILVINTGYGKVFRKVIKD